MTEQQMGRLQPKAALRGEPSYVWRFGQERRLDFIRRFVRLEGATVLDIGCGIGTYVQAFQRFTPHAYGIDIDTERLRRGSRTVPGLAVAVSEHLPFKENVFDLVLLNEVIEHVRDEGATLREAWRVTRQGGTIVIYAPNRLYPFETHGVYIGPRYIFGNIPLVNYLPTPLRDRLVPHARAYTEGRLRRLVATLDAEILVHTWVFPGFDNIATQRPRLGQILRTICYRLERSPLRILGLSHLVVLRKR